ncbi:MAG: plasmid partitioning protein RepB C-terminal domain-containing protein [Rickettsiales bacterium]|jgi:hypothetical protein
MSTVKNSKILGDIKMGFENDTIVLPLKDITPLKIITADMRNSIKFKQIIASIREVGIIEPPVVSIPAKGQKHYMLLDGHLRIEALKIIDEEQVTCLVSTDNESFTYNKYISRLATIQEHRMIVQAIKRGVSEEKLARALNINVKQIIYKRDILNGICSEVVEILKDKVISTKVFGVLRQMKPIRQIEVVTLMRDANNYTSPYASALLAATPQPHLTEPSKPKKVRNLTQEQMARMEAEMGSLQGQYRLIEDSFGPNVLTLTVAKTWLSKLLGNARIVKYLAQQHPEYLAEFQKITEITSLASTGASL